MRSAILSTTSKLTPSSDHLVVTIVNTISLIARTQRQPPFNTFFLLNIAYLRENICIEPLNDSLIDYLSKPTTLNYNFRTTKASYLDANFSPLMQRPEGEAGQGGDEGEVYAVL